MILILSFLVVAAAAAQEPAGPSASESRTVWDGVYNTAQAERGQAAYSAHCASCHRDDLSGYNSLLLGARFMEKYREASLHLLFDKIKTTMPRNAAGSLSDETYVDIVAYILQVNDFPSGRDELSVDDVPRVRLIGKGGPSAVPNFSLVRILGCLVHRGDEWLVINATEPVRTGLPQPAAGDLAGITIDRGSGTFSLLSYHAYAPDTHLGRNVEVRGFLILRSAGDRINVTSIETVGPACE